MAARLLVYLLPLGTFAARLLIKRLLKEVGEGDLPEKLQPFAAEIQETCEFLLSLLDAFAAGKPDAPFKVVTDPPAAGGQ